MDDLSFPYQIVRITSCMIVIEIDLLGSRCEAQQIIVATR